ncbi:MAG: 3'-5' exonuclease [Erysipelotrichaceae bacterium]|nr:3'-5' exonuclease [Erysipelotrichaceae bacterium]
MMVKYSDLNKQQKEAVIDESKHLRIIAGAGSGKTRVLTMRIAYLIEKKDVPPFNILAITFTNKAAKEMKKRIMDMLGDEGSGVHISTIHSLCMRILAEDIGALGYPRNFTVVDADDQRAILKEAYKEYRIDKKDLSYGTMLDYISNNKYMAVSPQIAMKMAYGDKRIEDKAKVFAYYENRLKSMYGLDFDDLILFTTRLFKLNPTICEKWSRKYRYIHVDEFQDIDNEQYTLIKQLSSCHDNIYVVGDPDQTIYTWRGADVNIIMNFEKDFKDTRTIVLTQNYRSTNNILSGANSLIKNNRARIEKDLFSNKGAGSKIRHKKADSEYFEAVYVVNTIVKKHADGQNYSDFAVLYRSNYLSREIEKVLLENRIPYVITGGIRFYERMEVKDMLCYLRMITRADDLAFTRIINTPKRGIGQKTLDNILALAKENDLTMYEVVKQGLYRKNKETFNEFVTMVERWRNNLETMPLNMLMQAVLDESGYRTMLEKENEIERLENIKSLIDDISEYAETYPDSTLDEYLQMIALYTDRASMQDSEAVNLMTVHASKGLEFDTVFVIGMSDGIFPNERAIQESGMKGLEEERRLAYVAYTRAMNNLYLSESAGYSYVTQSEKTSSRFISEIDQDYIDHLDERKRKVSVFDEPIALPAERSTKKADDCVYRVNDQIIHKIYGEGRIVSIDGDLVNIAFPYPIGIKKMLAKHPSFRKKEGKDFN